MAAMPYVSRMRARTPAAVVGLVLAGAVIASSTPTTSEAADHSVSDGNLCRRSVIDVPSCGVLWGMFMPPAPVPGKSHWSAGYPAIEKSLGRRLDLVKKYEGWGSGERFPSARDRRLTTHGRTLYLSWDPVNYVNGRSVSYASIARGHWDRSVIRPEARRIKQFHRRLFIDFGHEFDTPANVAQHGPARAFAAAYRHIEDVMRAAGVRNVIWSWASTGYLGHEGEIRAGYPGARYVDWIGYDPYNFAECTGSPWRSPYGIAHTFYRWTQHQPSMRNKPLVLSEYGSAAGPNVKRWYAGIPSALRRLPRIRALIQFSGPTDPPCAVQLSASPQAMAGFTKAAHARSVIGR